MTSTMDTREISTKSLEIQESADGIFLMDASNVDKISTKVNEEHSKDSSRETNTRESTRQHRVPYFHSYVPFGTVFSSRFKGEVSLALYEIIQVLISKPWRTLDQGNGRHSKNAI